MTFKPSIFQENIFNFVSHGKGSALVEAVAGSGKSTTIKRSILRIPERATIRVFAFNKKIADEMKMGVKQLCAEHDRLENGIWVSTFHSYGFGLISRKLNRKFHDFTIDGRKVLKILEGELDEKDPSGELFEAYGSFCAKLVSLAKGQAFGAIAPIMRDDWYELIHHHDLVLETEWANEEDAINYARMALSISNLEARQNLSIDYDDQIYLPLLWKCSDKWANDWVFIDEAQDTNPARRALAKLALKPGGRLMAVGDRRQAIYGFTGASHDAMDLIKSEFGCTEFPLSVSYRCSKAVVRRAQTIVDHIEAFESANEGEVLYCNLKDALARLQATDVIMCRNVAPLISLSFRLVARGVANKVLGREIGSNLIGMLDRQKAKGLQNLLDKLNSYREREMAKHIAAGEEGKAEAINDRVECITIIADNLEEKERTIPGLKRRIELLFSDDENHTILTLCTLHKSKGLEFHRAAIYRPELCPSKFARQDWQLLQEENLMYVGITRAKEELIFISEEP